MKISFARPLGCEKAVLPLTPEKESLIVGVTIGTFDGLHQAHKVLVDRLHETLESIVDEERNRSQQDIKPYSVMLNFYPHPRTVVGRPVDTKGIDREAGPVDDYQKLLTPLRVRAIRARAMGLSELRMLHFTSSLSKVDAETFLRNCIFEPLMPKVVVVGFDWSFGKGREGSISLLKEIASQYGCEVLMVNQISHGNEKIGARQIRVFLREGKISEANSLLGYPFMIEGKVVKGDGRGSQIGIPTANLKVVRQFLPASGVYKTKVRIDGEEYLSITNVGVRPTFKPNAIEQVVETHILDFNKNIYDKRMQVEFLDWVRPEMKFSSVDALVSQIHADIDAVKSSLFHA